MIKIIKELWRLIVISTCVFAIGGIIVSVAFLEFMLITEWQPWLRAVAMTISLILWFVIGFVEDCKNDD